MESAIFHLNTHEVDERFVQSIRALFGERRITVTVTPEANEVMNQALLEKIEANERATMSYHFSAEDFDTLVEAFAEDESFDLKAAFEQHKSAPSSTVQPS
ncbi:MAG: hypothetical protein LH606_21510 [Cytophagaceae bacterium]|nr:hypothetical protein [Cytophagaceae bacterium]